MTKSLLKDFVSKQFYKLSFENKVFLRNMPSDKEVKILNGTFHTVLNCIIRLRFFVFEVNAICLLFCTTVISKPTQTSQKHFGSYK